MSIEPGAGNASIQIFRIYATDGMSLVNLDVTVTATADQSPAVSPVSAPTIREGASYAQSVSAEDLDGDTIAFELFQLSSSASTDTNLTVPSWATLSITGTSANKNKGTFKVTSAAPTGTYYFRAYASAGLYTDQYDFPVTVVGNNAPMFMEISTTTLVLHDTSTSVFFSASDADGDTLTFDTSGLPSWCSISAGPTSGRIKAYPPPTVAEGTNQFELKVWDDAPIPATASRDHRVYRHP